MSTWQNTLGLTRPSPDTLDRTDDWRAGAPCYNPGIGEDDDPFFHPEGETGKAKRDRVRMAQRICADCPLAARCLEYAIENGEQHGVWGGVTEDERLPMIRARRAGRRGTSTTHAPRETKPCTVPSCNRVAHTAGRCYRHHQMATNRPSCGTDQGYRRHRDLGEDACTHCRAAKAAEQKKVRARRGPCTVEGCNRKSIGRGLCRPHAEHGRQQQADVIAEAERLLPRIVEQYHDVPLVTAARRRDLTQAGAA